MHGAAGACATSESSSSNGAKDASAANPAVVLAWFRSAFAASPLLTSLTPEYIGDSTQAPRVVFLESPLAVNPASVLGSADCRSPTLLLRDPDAQQLTLLLH